MTLLRTLLSNRHLARVELAWAVAALGNWAFSILLAIYAYREGGTDAVALALAVRMVPAGFAAPGAAMLADRHSRRAILLWSSILRAAALAGAALAAAGSAPLGIVLIFAALFTILNTAHRPAQAALMPLLARVPTELAAANIAWSATEYLGFLLGGVVAGVLAGLIALDLAFAVCAAAFVVTALIVGALPRDERPEPLTGASSRAAELTGGLRIVVADSDARLLVGIYAITAVVQGVIDVLLIIAAIELLGLGESGAGWLNAAWGAGGVVGGAASFALLARGRLTAGLASGLALAGAGLALTGAWTAPAAAFPLLIGMGVGFALVDAVLLTLTQRLAADDVLARVFGVRETVEVLALGLGSALAAALVAIFDLSTAMLATGAVLALTGLVVGRRLAGIEAGRQVPERNFRLVRSLPMLAPLPVAILENLAVRLEERRYAAGEQIVKERELGDAFYVIADGEVEVHSERGYRGRLAAGDFFGEIALLHDIPRTATVTAVDDVTALVIQREPFLAAIGGHTRSASVANAVAGDRLAQNGPSRSESPTVSV